MKKKRLHVLIMQITFLQIAISLSLMASAIAKDSKAQLALKTSVTIDVKSEKFSKVLTSLEQQSKISFIYSSAIINSDRRVSISVVNKSLETVLKELLPPLNLSYQASGDVVLITRRSKDKSEIASAPLSIVRVTGRVTDEKGEALPGVSVRVVGTNSGTVTDINGVYSISVPDGASITFSYIGFQSQTVAAKEGTLNIVMKLDELGTKLNEVVVVGYGTQKRSDITGSVASVPKERLSKLPVNNVMQAIQGAVANVTVNQASSIPGDAPSVQVRGRNSITASSSPFIVVDGIPLTKTDGSINDINPNDIESVEILKDPSSVAIYGVNGSNGVILITTKRGTTGKPVIRYSTYAGVENATDVLEGVSGEEMLARYKEYARINQLPLYNGGPVRNEYEFENYQNGVTTDWIDAVMRQGVNQNHNLSVSGGSETAKYYVSGDYMSQKGVILGYDYKRYGFRVNTDIKPTSYITVGTSSFMTYHNRDGGRAHLQNAMAMSPYARMYEADGRLTQHPMRGEQLWANPLLPTTINPLRRSFNMTLNGYGELNLGELVKPLNGLKYRFNGGYTYFPGRENLYEGKSVYNMTGFARLINTESQTYTLENILTYNKDIGKHHFDFTGLYAAKQKYYQSVTAEGSNFPNDDLEWGNINGAATQVTRSFADKYNTISQMGRLNYGFDSRYLLTLTVRRDGSSVFGRNNKYGTFPAAAVAWNIHNESFMKPLGNAVSNLKLRVSYGLAGNEAINIYESLALLNTNGLAMGGQSRTALETRALMGNANLQWEKARSFNTGLDFGFLNNRISGSVDVYKTNTYDLLLNQALARITGYERVISNIGKLSNSGVDLTLNSRNFTKKDFTWSTTAVFATNRNKIVSLYGDGRDDIGNSWFLGQPVGVIYDYTYLGIWQQDEIDQGLHTNWDANAKAGDVKLADINKDGKIDATNDRTILGQTSPKWTGGLTNTFTYKNFSLNVFINTVQGVLRNNSQINAASDEMGRRNAPAVIGYWTPENKSNEWRSLHNQSNRYNYRFASDASFTRLKDVTLSYDLPKSLMTRIGISGIQVYASGRNLYTWTNWIGWDPEARDINRGSENDNLNYPMVRSFVFGANVNF
ncbi:TonB-dependent receptor [Pedobacter sp. SYSU D00535]|uniref:TonB-dependent receptor n=1 Tax=Pedobacter sp. SYSU D00535 TaxID=2810308 RepID=UPI001A95E834|nr:TonB-dependent receptor [Pedobacter sp. SYSU D00535]